MKKIIVLILSLFVSILVIKANEITQLEINDNTYLHLPSFANQIKIMGINSSKVFKDENGVLNNFEIEYSDIDAIIIDNNLKVNAKKEGTYTIRFIKKSSGEIDDIKFNINIKVVSGSVTVIAVDSENKDRLEANLENFNVDLYKGNTGFGNIYIDENNSGSRYNLPFGEYVVKNRQTPYGYKLQNIEEWIYIWEGSYDIKVYLNYEVIKGNLIINKYCGNEIDNEAEFEIYHNDTLVKRIKGNSNHELEFGTYLIKQVNGKKHYNFIEDFIVTINKEKDYVYNLESDILKEVENIINNKDLEVEKLQQDILKYQDELLNKTNEILNYEQLLSQKENELLIYKDYLLEKENKIIESEKEIKMLKDEILKRKEINKKLELKLINKKDIEEKQIILEQKEDVLVVNVPDTYRKNNNKLISKTLIVIGLILIIINLIYKKKTIL